MTVQQLKNYLDKFDPNLPVVVNFTDTTDWTDQFDLQEHLFKIGDRWCDGMREDVDGDESVLVIDLSYDCIYEFEKS